MPPKKNATRKTILRSAAKALATLRAKPNVLYMTTGEKRTEGIRTGEQAIVVYVANKPKKLQKSQSIPKTIRTDRPAPKEPKRIRTDVVLVEHLPEAFGARSGQLLRSFDNDLGVCGLTFVKNGIGYVLTNAHVACDVSASSYGHGSLLDRERNLFFSLGPVVYWTPMSAGSPVTDDTAVLRADHWIVDHLGIVSLDQSISSFGDIADAPHANYWYNVNGAIFQCAHGERVVGTAPINVDGRIFAYAGFWQLQMTVGSAAPGHSGALLCRTFGAHITACGLVFGGVQPNFVFAFPIKPLYRRAFERL